MTSPVAETPARERVLERGDGLARREVHEMDRAPFAPREREVALDHDALGGRRVRADPELGGDRALVRVTAVRERRLLAVEREPQDR